MLLKKIFKPKWQHSNPEVRKAAVEQLDWNARDDRTTLETIICKDPSVDIVKLALVKVNRADDLLALLSSASSTSHPIVRARLVQLAENAANNTQSFIENTLNNGDAKLLSELITELKSDLHLADFFSPLAANSADLLASIAIGHPLSQVRQVAVDSIDQPDLLTTIASATKTKDKGVYQKARAKLQARRQREQQQQEQRQAIENLCQNLESHADTDATRHYIEKLDALERKYVNCLAERPTGSGNINTIYMANNKELAARRPSEPFNGVDADFRPDPKLLSRIEKALIKCRSKAAEIEKIIAANQQLQWESQQQETDRRGTIDILNATIEQLKNKPSNDLGELAALDGLIKTQQNRWLEATKNQTVNKSEQKEYQNAMGELQQFFNAGKNLVNHADEISALTASARQALESSETANKALLKQLRKTVNQVEWPDGFPLPDILAESAEVAGQIQTIQIRSSEDAGRQRKKTEDKIKQLGNHIGNGELKQALRLSKDIHLELKKLPHNIKQELTSLLRSKQVKLDELKDWKGYVTLPKQESLCKRMEYLSNQHLEPHIKANKIKELQDEWRSLGGSQDQKLWQKFKHFADLAYEPCKEFFGEEEKLKMANLKKREAICEQLEVFNQQMDWQNPDWKAVDKINRKAREEWRSYYPVDHKKAKSVQHKFNGLLAKLDEQLGQEKENNHQLKRKIVEAANALLTETDIREATRQAKALQQDWQSIGITDHRTDRQLWGQFRKACDAIFEKLEAQHQQQKEAQQQALHHANELVQRISALESQVDENTENQLQRLIEEFNQSKQQNDNLKQVIKPFQSAVKQIKSAIDNFKTSQFKHYYGGLIEHVFASTHPLTNQLDASEQATGTAFLPQHLALFKQAPTDKQAAAGDILLRMEILAEIDSPEAEQERRMELQVARLSEGLSGATTIPASKINQFEDLLLNWLESSHVEFLEASHRSRMLAVLEKIVGNINP